jgi:hypothetical protein
MAGESAGIILVNSSEKLLTSNSFVILGIKGAGTAFWARAVQSVPCGVRHTLLTTCKKLLSTDKHLTGCNVNISSFRKRS